MSVAVLLHARMKISENVNGAEICDNLEDQDAKAVLINRR